MRAIFVKYASVAGTHEQASFREPAHRASQMGAVNGENLKLLARNPADVNGSLPCVAVTAAAQWIDQINQSSLSLVIVCDGSSIHPIVCALLERAEQEPDNGNTGRGCSQGPEHDRSPLEQTPPLTISRILAGD